MSNSGFLVVWVLIQWLFLFPTSSPTLSAEMNPVKIKRRAFREHLKENEIWEKRRLKDFDTYLDETEKWELQRLRNLEVYRKENHGKKEKDAHKVKILAFEEYLDEVETWERQRLKNKQKFIEELKKVDMADARYSRERALFEIEEFDLYDRPRYDYKVRSNFAGRGGRGAGITGKGGAGGSNSGSGGSDSGYIPAPSYPSYESPNYDGGDIPPPPPPGDFESGMPMDNNLEIPPPPPPPPPMNSYGN